MCEVLLDCLKESKYLTERNSRVKGAQEYLNQGQETFPQNTCVN